MSPCCENPELMTSDGVTICFSCKSVFDSQENPNDSEIPTILPAHLPDNNPCCENPYISPDHKEGVYLCISCGKIQHEGILEYYNFDEDGTSTHVEGGRVGDSRQVIRGIKASKWNFIAYSTRDKISIKTHSLIVKYSLPAMILPMVMDTYDSLDHSQGMLRGKDMDTICSALIYVTLKNTKNCRSMHECANMTGVSVKKFTRILKFIDEKTKEKVDKSNNAVSDKTVMINQYMSAIGFSPMQKKETIRNLEKVESAPIAMYTKFAIAMYGVALQHEDSTDIIADIIHMLNVRKPTVVKNYDKYLKSM